MGINIGNVLLESRYYCSKRNIFDKLSLSTKNNIEVVQHYEKKVAQGDVLLQSNYMEIQRYIHFAWYINFKNGN